MHHNTTFFKEFVVVSKEFGCAVVGDEVKPAEVSHSRKSYIKRFKEEL